MPAVPQRRVPAAAPAPDMGTTADLSDVHPFSVKRYIIGLQVLSVLLFGAADVTYDPLFPRQSPGRDADYTRPD